MMLTRGRLSAYLDEDVQGVRDLDGVEPRHSGCFPRAIEERRATVL